MVVTTYPTEATVEGKEGLVLLTGVGEAKCEAPGQYYINSQEGREIHADPQIFSFLFSPANDASHSQGESFHLN